MIQTCIHPTALVDTDAVVADGVEIGAYSIIHANVRIGAGSRIGSHCEVGLPTLLSREGGLDIGAKANIRSHCVIYQGSTIGDELVTGHYVTIRENSHIGRGFQLGNRGDVQGDCIIGDHVRTHADVHIGKHSELGNFIWLLPNVLLTNDPDPPSDQLLGVKIRDFAVIAANALIFPGVHIGRHSVVAAGSSLNIDVPDGMLAAGNPARIVCRADILRMHGDPSKKAYPWPQRFKRGYPESVVKNWCE